MGQQQLLLVVLGVIIVAIAVVVGINVFSSYSIEANKDALAADNIKIGSLAQKYYYTPAEMGGGGMSFVGFAIPDELKETATGSFSALRATASSVIIVGKGNVKDSNGKVYQVVTTITAKTISTGRITLVSP